MTRHLLIDPVVPGRTVDRWRLSDTLEERFDVAPEPLSGAMDAGFFLTGERNYIPHEYPCRREYARLRRGRRSEPAIAFAPRRWWFPFGAERVDLSGFWFRPTRVETWARTGLIAERALTARVRLSTCGAAALYLNGTEAGWLAPCRRNWEEAVEIDLPLRAGENEVSVWFSDLCERDARYFFALRLLEGDGLAAALPVPVAPERARALESLLEGMRFERPAYADDARVTIRFDRPTFADLAAAITVRGDFISADSLRLERRLPAGADRLELAPARDLPADYRDVHLNLRDGEMELGRAIGVEIIHGADQPEAAADPRARAAEALDHVALDAEPDAVRALARLATGRGGPETDAMILACLPAIEDTHDCADFLLVPLLWGRMRWGDAIGPAARARLDAAILGFRHWMDEPGDDVMWYFSENHALLFHVGRHLGGTLFPEARFVRSGRAGAEQAVAGAEALRRWFDHFEACEMAEWNSAPYFPIDLKGLCALYALSPEPDIRARAERAIGRLLRIVAASCHRGALTASQGRSYEHTLRPARTQELSAIGRLAWGYGWFGRRFHALPQLALCVRDHGFRPDDDLRDLAFVTRGAREWLFRQGEGGFAPLYHYKTRHFAIGSVAAYRPGRWGYQETVLHLRLGERPEAQVWINHPGETLQGGFGRPSFWGGCGILPRLHQYRGLAALRFDAHPDTPDFTHAFVPEAEFDEVQVDGADVWLRAGEAFALLRAGRPLERVASGPSAGCEVRLPGRSGTWIVRLADTGAFPHLAAFRAAMAGLALEGEAETPWLLRDPEYGPVRCDPAGTVAAEGRILDPASWTLAGTLRTFDD